MNAAAFAGGLVFGLGLVISGMADPQKVLAFLTLGAGWDPALIYVMASAVVVATIGYALARRRAAPLLATEFSSPSRFGVDARLLSGAALFGVGWGFSGYCPGPALVGAFVLDVRAVAFLAAFTLGVFVHRWLEKRGDGALGSRCC